VTRVTALALGLSVFCQAGLVAAAEQETAGTHAAMNAPSDGAPKASAASASGTAPTDTEASDTPALDTPASDATAADSAAPVCFKLTSHCIDSKTQGSVAASGKSTRGNNSADAKTGKARPLNLNAPDVRSVVPMQELKEPLPTTAEQNAAEETNTVQVAGDSNTPDVPGGFGALWWAIRNPAQAWRIVAPVQ
jgi:hypothetical protein